MHWYVPLSAGGQSGCGLDPHHMPLPGASPPGTGGVPLADLWEQSLCSGGKSGQLSSWALEAAGGSGPPKGQVAVQNETYTSWACLDPPSFLPPISRLQPDLEALPNPLPQPPCSSTLTWLKPQSLHRGPPSLLAPPTPHPGPVRPRPWTPWAPPLL